MSIILLADYIIWKFTLQSQNCQISGYMVCMCACGFPYLKVNECSGKSLPLIGGTGMVCGAS